jgi:hypothetical protein
VDGDLKTGSARLPHAIGAARADIRGRQKQPVEAREEIVVTAWRGPARASRPLQSGPSEKKKLPDSLVPLQQVDQRRDTDQRAAAGVDVDLEGDPLHRTGNR